VPAAALLRIEPNHQPSALPIHLGRDADHSVLEHVELGDRGLSMRADASPTCISVY